MCHVFLLKWLKITAIQVELHGLKLGTNKEASHIYSFIQLLSSLAHLRNRCAVLVRVCCAYTRIKYRFTVGNRTRNRHFFCLYLQSGQLRVKSVTALMTVDSQSYVSIPHLSCPESMFSADRSATRLPCNDAVTASEVEENLDFGFFCQADCRRSL